MYKLYSISYNLYNITFIRERIAELNEAKLSNERLNSTLDDEYKSIKGTCI